MSDSIEYETTLPCGAGPVQVRVTKDLNDGGYHAEARYRGHIVRSTNDVEALRVLDQDIHARTVLMATEYPWIHGDIFREPAETE